MILFFGIFAKITPLEMPIIKYVYEKHRLKVDGQKAFRLTARNAKKATLTFSKGATTNETLSQSNIAFCA